MEYNLDFKKIKGITLDIDGTLLKGSKPMPGLMKFFSFLKKNKIKFIVASNNSTKSTKQYQQKFSNYGLDVSQENVLTAAVATTAYLNKHYPNGGLAYVIGKPSLYEAVQSAGFSLVNNSDIPVDIVVVGGDDGLTYDKLKYATLLIANGAKFIGTNPDVVYLNEEGFLPETGSILAALKASTDKDPVIIGKPQLFLFETAIQKLGIEPEQTAMLGDRLDTDIYGGKKARLNTILVTTGVDNEKTIPVKKIYPDLVVSGLPELTQKWHDALNSQ